MTPSEEKVRKFFRNEINKCSKISVRVDMKEILKEIYIEREDIISLVWALNQFIQKNKSWLNESESYFLSWKLISLSPILRDREIEFKKFLREVNCSYRNNEFILFEEDDLFFQLIRQEDSTLLIDTYYLIDAIILENLGKDISAIISNTSNIFNLETNESYDTNYNSFLFCLLLKKYNYIFSKQDIETKYLINEIQSLFFEGYSENIKGKLIAVIALITMVIEDNLIKMYKKSENKRPNEGYNINLLNNCIAKNETVEMRLISGDNYQLLSTCGTRNPVLYDYKARIYILIKDYADIIRNKVLHFQQSVTLDLFHTSVHAIKYLVNILMEIEDNAYL